MATILNGKQLSEKILKNLEKEVAQLDYIPKLGIIMVGEDPASLAYVEKKKKIGKDIGVEVELYKYDSDISTRKLRKQINTIQQAPQIKGV
ncbi:MAG: tetrahydrofolate dehydrogenase/cyclohydrolase catalytic domain-containing protein, partial [Candidatus Spechtbacterales bacterium]|nr:tetrahydrofolate dehydrogenase/cyclohydrolase catalytic domain-containing protein [Candidatus Spechtbacterales bacterium]